MRGGEHGWVNGGMGATKGVKTVRAKMPNTNKNSKYISLES